MAGERWFLIIMGCLLIILTLLYADMFIEKRIQANNIKNLTIQIQQRDAGINSFVSQLQRCETMKDVDKTLKSIGVERIK